MNLQEFKDEIIIKDMPYPNDENQVFEWITHKVKEATNYSSKIPMSFASYVPKAKDKLYFYPACNVPRYKVRDWGKKNNISITVMEDKATAKFATDQTLNKFIGYEVYTQIEKDKFINWLAINKYDASLDSYSRLVAEIKASTGEFVNLQNYSSNIHEFKNTTDWNNKPTKAVREGGLIQGYDDKKSSIVKEDYYRAHTITEKNYKLITSLLASAIIYNQEDIIGIINEDAITIDREMYTRLNDMFNASNQADHLVAMEIISNCNINPSLHHVLLLLRAHGQTITCLKESKHINFKSLLEYIGINRSSMYYLNEDKIVNILMEKDVLTLDNIGELASGIKKQMKENADTTHFLIAKITISDTIQEYLKSKQVQKESVLN